jgi:hypothetical protein
MQLIHAATFASVSTGVLQLQRSHSSLGRQHAHLLQYRLTVLESTRYHHPSSSGTLRSCRSRSSSTSVSSSISHTCHKCSYRLFHPKYTVSSTPISTGGPSFDYVLNGPRSWVVWTIDSWWRHASTTFSMKIDPILCRMQLRTSSRIHVSGTVLVA